MTGNPEVRFATVIDNKDETGGRRIKVKMLSREDSITGPVYAFPLLPKILHIMPKVGETVLIVSQDLTKPSTQRYYIGPIISQPQNFYNESRLTSARLLQGSRVGPDVNLEYEGWNEGDKVKYKIKGTQPDLEDVAILGRADSDVILKDNELDIRCGVKDSNPYDKTDFEFNKSHPAFIKLQHEPDNTKSDSNQFESAVSIVADKINLIGTDSREKYDIADKDNNNLLNEDQIKKFIAKAHQVPYGDVLIEFLDLFRNAFLTHQHKWAQMPPVVYGPVDELSKYQLNTMLSDTVRIN